MVDLPAELLDIQARYPWDGVADVARACLERRVPELGGYIATMPEAVFGLESGFFYLPAAQACAWGFSDDDWVAEFLGLLAVGHAHFAAQDLQVDAGRCPPELCLLSDVALLEYLDGLRRLAPSSDPDRYVGLHDVYYRWYVRGLNVELHHRRHLHSYSREEVLSLGLKAAPGNTTLHLAADQTDCHESVGDLVCAVMHLCSGLQVIDDLNDLKRDFEDRNFTMPVTATLKALGRHVTLDDIDPEELSFAAAASGVASTCMEIAEHCFDLAEASSDRAQASVARDLARVWRARTEHRRHSINGALEASGSAFES